MGEDESKVRVSMRQRVKVRFGEGMRYIKGEK